MNRELKSNQGPCPLLFSPFQLGRILLKNRLVALPVHTGFAHTGGQVSELMLESYRRLTASGPGLVVVANAAVSADGVVSRYNLRADGDQFIPGLARLARTIKQGGAVAALQLNHAGRFSLSDSPLIPSPAPSFNLSFNLSSLKNFIDFFPLEKRFYLTRYLLQRLVNRQAPMTADDRKRVIHDFADAAARAAKAGFDMVELHGANGYLLTQFLSPFTHASPPESSISLEDRAAFPMAVIRAIRQNVPDTFPVGYRLMLQEWVPDGIDLDQALAFVRHLEAEQISYLSVSAGTYNSIFSPDVYQEMARPGYLRKDTAELTRRTTIPTIISGRIVTPLFAQRLLREKAADLIGLGRPLRVDPSWIHKAKGAPGKIIPCINCNQCLKRVVLEQGFHCIQHSERARERMELSHKLLTRNYRSLWVISHEKEMALFKNNSRLLHLSGTDGIPPTLLFINGNDPSQKTEKKRNAFTAWARQHAGPQGPMALQPRPLIRSRDASVEQTVSDIVSKGQHGLIFLAWTPRQTWQERLIYRLTARVIVLVNENVRSHQVLVPVDFSAVTPLVLCFLHQTGMDGNTEKENMGNKEFILRFVHVGKKTDRGKIRKWKEMKRISGLASDACLEFLKRDKDVVTTLIKAVVAGNHGMVVMGKRGKSGIKRWLPGSVSAGVMRRLTDQSLILID